MFLMNTSKYFKLKILWFCGSLMICNIFLNYQINFKRESNKNIEMKPPEILAIIVYVILKRHGSELNLETTDADR